jgi:hypothetical protein
VKKIFEKISIAFKIYFSVIIGNDSYFEILGKK